MTLCNNFSQKTRAGGGHIFEKLRYICIQFELTEVGRLFLLQPGNGEVGNPDRHKCIRLDLRRFAWLTLYAEK